jgi:hypothetical protein
MVFGEIEGTVIEGNEEGRRQDVANYVSTGGAGVTMRR